VTTVAIRATAAAAPALRPEGRRDLRAS